MGYSTDMSFCHKLKFSNSFIYASLDLPKLDYLTNRIHSLKYQRSTTSGSKDKVFIKPKFVGVAKTMFLQEIDEIPRGRQQKS